jgi:hypothetical protein
MYRGLGVVVVAIALIVSQSAASGTDAPVARYLESIHFPSSYRQSIQRRIQQTGSSDAIVQRLSQLTDQQILTAVVPIVHAQLSDGDANTLADFFSSPAAQAMAAHQQLTDAQEAQIKEFTTQHSALMSKMSQFFHDPNEQRQIIAALLTAK